jgi:hypothetical protein
MARNDIRFSSIKEDREWYFVEYFPPLPKYRFSMLQLSILEPRDVHAVATVMESEAKYWLAHYPVPLMATAFSLDGSLLDLKSARPINHLMAWRDITGPTENLHWELVPDEKLPAVALDRNFLRTVFANIPFKTGREIKDEAAKYIAAQKLGWWLVFFWAVIVPLGVAVLEWWSNFLGLVVVCYAFFKASIGTLRLTGRLPKSRRAREKEAKELKMRHYYYHCERNPKAFQRLKIENFTQEEIERTKAEAAVLKSQHQPSPTNT